MVPGRPARIASNTVVPILDLSVWIRHLVISGQCRMNVSMSQPRCLHQSGFHHDAECPHHLATRS